MAVYLVAMLVEKGRGGKMVLNGNEFLMKRLCSFDLLFAAVQ